MRRFIVSIILGTMVMSAHRDCLAATNFSAPRQSPAVTPSLSLTTTAGMFLFDSHRNLEASPSYGIRLGYDIIGRNAIDSLGVEVGLDMAMTRLKSNKSAANAYLLRTEAFYSILPRGRFVPSFVVGVGGMYVDGGGSTSANVFFDYGASVKYFLKDYLALRMDVRHIFAYEDTAARSNFESTLGLSFFLSYDKDLKRVPPVDSDGDGVPDYLDKCPETPKGVKVDKDGCPVDSDGDGVPDYLDKCPGTPAGVKVDKNGCPLDSDGDGVPDYLDKCPGTPAGVKVDKDGCPAKATELSAAGSLPPAAMASEPEGAAKTAPQPATHPPAGAASGTGEAAKTVAPGAKPSGASTGKGMQAIPQATLPGAAGAPGVMTDCTVKINGVSLLDSDCDGVPDYLDKCPGTPWGVAVDKDGCPTGSAAPATQGSTTQGPTNQVPATQIPTAKVPKAKVPTTQVPTTLAPEIQAPAAQVPTAQTPTTRGTTTRVPTAKVPKAKVPTTQVPTTPAPEIQAPAAQVPAAQVPATQVPAAQVPTAQTPTTQGPINQVPTAKVPKAKVPTNQVPTTSAQETQAPVAQTPEAQTPAVQIPTVQTPSTPASLQPFIPPVVSTPAVPTPEKPGATPGPGKTGPTPGESAPIVIEVPIKSLLPRQGMSSTGYFTSAVDRCPPTPESRIAYDEKPLMKLVINFRVDKADIDQKYFKKIKEIYDFMKKNPDALAHVEGHADYTGPFDYNITLSRIRAINIKNQILHNGDIDPERISVNAYGCSIPIADNRTIEGRRKNRRGVTVITLTVTGPTVVTPPSKVSPHEKAEPAHTPIEPGPIPVEVMTKPLLPRKGVSSTGYFISAADRCPPTPESRVVYDEKPLMKLVVNFRTDKADIDQKYYKKIKEIYAFMKKNPTVFAHVEGHADYTGPFDYNITLSRIRAINIKNQILHNGDIDPERISINAYGCSIPIADNRTAEGRRKNRRGVTVITLTITGPTVVK